MGFVDIKCATLAASRSSYDDSSWRQTAFSQSVALMSLLCPSVRSEGWLSHVCVGDHSTVGPSQAFLSLISCLLMACQRGQYITTAIMLTKLCFYLRAPCFFLRECVGCLSIAWVCSIQGVFVCSLPRACNFYTSPAILPRFRLTDFKILQAFKVQNAVVQTFNIYL